MRKPLVPLVCIVLPLLWSCAPRQTELVKVVDWSADESFSWKGRTREELLAALGRPTHIKPDGKGGEVYAYAEISVGGSGSDFPYDPGVVDVKSPNINFPDYQFWNTEVIATFWLAEDGVVYEHRVAPRLKKKIQVPMVRRVP